MFRKTVNILGMVCLILVLAAGAGAGYLAAKGTLNSESVKAAVAAVTSRPAEGENRPGADPKAEPSEPNVRPANELLAEGREAEAAEAGRLEMLKRQLANEQALLEAARVNLQREQEQFEQHRRQWEASRQKELEAAQLSGAQKELEYLASIKPAQALEVLRDKSDGEAARVLMAMETRKGKKIIELCKTTDEKEWRKRILELIRQQSNVQAQALAGG